MSRIRLGLTNEEAESMRYGRWSDIFKEYKFLYNMETKKMLYAAEEEEMKRYQQVHRHIDSTSSI